MRVYWLLSALVLMSIVAGCSSEPQAPTGADAMPAKPSATPDAERPSK